MTDSKQNLAEIARKKRHLHLIEKMHNGKALSKQEITELEQFEAEPLAPTIVKTLDEVARVMGVSYRTAQRWKKDGMPETKDGYYDLETVRTWHAARLEEESSAEGKAFWEERIRKYRATMLELELKKMTGELVSRDEVESGRIARIISVKRSLLAVPTRLAPVLAMKEPREIESVLYEALSEIIDEFSGVRKTHETIGNKPQHLDAAGTAGVEASGKDNGQPLGGSKPLS